MKLATLGDRTRDGMLVVVSRDLTRCVSARPIAATLQQALDDWGHVGPRLADLAHDLELGAIPSERFHEHDAMSPLPRAFQRIDGPPPRQERSDGFVAPRAVIQASAGDAVSVSPGLAAITGDLAAGADRDAAAAAVRLLLLVLDAARADPDRRGFDGAPVATFSPVAVTPDEFGEAELGALAPAVLLSVNGAPTRARHDPADLAGLIVAAAASRDLGAGTIVAAVETDRLGLAPGDVVRLEARNGSGQSLFGAIEQRVGAEPAED